MCHVRITNPQPISIQKTIDSQNVNFHLPKLNGDSLTTFFRLRSKKCDRSLVLFFLFFFTFPFNGTTGLFPLLCRVKLRLAFVHQVELIVDYQPAVDFFADSSLSC